jgi:hypothetical protein
MATVETRNGQTVLQQFKSLLRASKNSWALMRAHDVQFWAEGLLWDRGEWLLPVTLTFVPGGYRSEFCIQGVVADRVCGESPRYLTLLNRANAAVKYARAISCDEERVLIVRTDLDFALHSGPDPDQVKRRFTDLIRLIRHPALKIAADVAHARWLAHGGGQPGAGQQPENDQRVSTCEET